VYCELSPVIPASLRHDRSSAQCIRCPWPYLGPDVVLIVPAVAEHCPRADQQVSALLFAPKGTATWATSAATVRLYSKKSNRPHSRPAEGAPVTRNG